MGANSWITGKENGATFPDPRQARAYPPVCQSGWICMAMEKLFQSLTRARPVWANPKSIGTASESNLH